MTQDEITQGRERLARWMGWELKYEPRLYTNDTGYYRDDTGDSTILRVDWLPDQNDSQMRMIREKMNDEERNLFMNELVRLLESIEWFEMVNAPLDIQFECAIKAIGEQK